MEDENHVMKNLNWYIDIMFSVFKKMITYEKGKSFKQPEVTKWKIIRHINLPKHSDL